MDCGRHAERGAEFGNRTVTTAYFTFGQSHVHSIGGFTYDKDVLVKIRADDPRQRMFDLFGQKWGMQYDEPPSPEFYPRGIKEIPS